MGALRAAEMAYASTAQVRAGLAPIVPEPVLQAVTMRVTIDPFFS